jgi:hypothetical protein
MAWVNDLSIADLVLEDDLALISRHEHFEKIPGFYAASRLPRHGAGTG